MSTGGDAIDTNERLAWDPQHGPPPAWIPPEEVRCQCHLGRLLDRLGFATEADFRAWTIRDRAGFWATMVEALGIRFDRPFDTVLDLTDGPERPRWFCGARLDITDSCFPVGTDPEAIAVREWSEDGKYRERGYGELDWMANRIAATLTAAGLAPGDAVGLLLPSTIEAVEATLGIIRAGCVVVGVAESFAPPEIALRLRLGGARLVITQQAIRRRGSLLPLYPKLESLDGIPAIVIPTAGVGTPLRAGDRTWREFFYPAFPPEFTPVPREPSARTIILFSSGTTGEPKAIPWTATTLIKAAADGFLYQDIQPGDVVAWPSSPGWMMGPWLVFATLINRGTIALYDGHPGTEGRNPIGPPRAGSIFGSDRGTFRGVNGRLGTQGKGDGPGKRPTPSACVGNTWRHRAETVVSAPRRTRTYNPLIKPNFPLDRIAQLDSRQHVENFGARSF